MSVPVVPALPIFPLPNAVLLPGELLPLHVFEPRYRALVAACLADDGLLGIATLKPGYEQGYEGKPAVWPELGMGRIAQHRALPDGRSNILVAFVAAGRIEAELSTPEPFRRVRFVPYAPLEEAPANPGLQVLAAQALVQLKVPDVDQVLRGSTDMWMDGLARMLLRGAEERRAWLRARTPGERARVMEAALVGVMTGGWGEEV